MANTYEVASLIAEAAQLPTLNTMLAESGIEGCTAKMLVVACWPDDVALIYNPDGSVNMAASPAPSHYAASGWVHVDALDLLPQDDPEAP